MHFIPPSVLPLVTTIATPPVHRKSLWLQNLPPLIRGVPSLKPARRKRNPTIHPSSASVLGSSFIASYLLGSPTTKPTKTSPVSTHQVHMANLAPNTMPYMASLNVPDLTNFFNDPISHDPTWPAMLTKLPLDIPKSKGNLGKNPLTM